ncbi:MAG: HAD family phosphatase [Verrucomicrobia bacterium]|nr:HAD family phosphatase [Verrucomicrobiota bacterium]
MTQPQAVVFDLGKVLVDFDYGIAARRFAARATLPAPAIQDFVERSPTLSRFESGLINNQEFYQEVCRATGYQGTFAEFAMTFAGVFWPIEPMIRWQAGLRARGVPTYVFSNTNDLAISEIRRSFPFFSNFDGYIYSYQHGAMKPAPKIYQALEHLAGCQGPDILYLDDRPENIETGRARGWQVILQETPEKTLNLVRQWWPA